VNRLSRRSFLLASGVAGLSYRGLSTSSALEPGELAKANKRPNVLYGLTTGSWQLVTPPGKPLPLLQILDETAASGFNGIRLTGYPQILEENSVSIDQLGDELQKRGLVFSTISFGGHYRDREQQKEILARLRGVLEVHRKFGATAATFFPSLEVQPGEDEHRAYEDTFRFYNQMGKMAVQEYGVRMGVHNLPGSLISTPRQIDRFLEHTDSRYVFCAWDTAHLLLDGCDVAATFRKSLKRIVYLDFEDATRNPSKEDFVTPNGQRFAGDTARGQFYNSSQDLGRGEVDYPTVMNILAQDNYRGWIIPDLHAVRISAMESWRIAMDYIRGELDPVYQ